MNQLERLPISFIILHNIDCNATGRPKCSCYSHYTQLIKEFFSSHSINSNLLNIFKKNTVTGLKFIIRQDVTKLFTVFNAKLLSLFFKAKCSKSSFHSVIVPLSCLYQKHFTIHNKLSFFTILFVTMLFLSYKLITTKSSIELIKNINTAITFKQISILKAVICISKTVRK